MTVLSSPGRMPVPVFRITFTLRSRLVKRFYEGQRALKLAVVGLRRAHKGTDHWNTMHDFKIELIAAAPIDVTGSYTK